MKVTIEIPEGHELIQEGNTFRSVKKETKWKPNFRENYFVVSKTGKIDGYNFRDDEVDELCFKTGNCFKTKEEAEKSIFYFVLNSEYHYWIPGMEKPKEIPEGCQYFFAEKWNKEEHYISGWESYVRRWPK